MPDSGPCSWTPQILFATGAEWEIARVYFHTEKQTGPTYLDNKSYVIWQVKARVCCSGTIKIGYLWVVRQIDFESDPNDLYVVYNTNQTNWSVGNFAKAISSGGKYILKWLTNGAIDAALSQYLIWASSDQDMNDIYQLVDGTQPGPIPVAGNAIPVGNYGTNGEQGAWQGATVDWHTSDVPYFTDGGPSPCDQ